MRVLLRFSDIHPPIVPSVKSTTQHGAFSAVSDAFSVTEAAVSDAVSDPWEETFSSRSSANQPKKNYRPSHDSVNFERPGASVLRNETETVKAKVPEPFYLREMFYTCKNKIKA
jgi:hypothetical protein